MHRGDGILAHQRAGEGEGLAGGEVEHGNRDDGARPDVVNEERRFRLQLAFHATVVVADGRHQPN